MVSIQRFTLDDIFITNTRPEHAPGVAETVRLTYQLTPDEEREESWINANDVREQLIRFPEGQFVALYKPKTGKEMVVGMAATMRTSYPPTAPPLQWLEAIGGKTIRNHEPHGEWLYGVEMAVRPDFRKGGIGTSLYKARFQLVKHLNLRGWYAGGVLMGYHRFRHKLSPREYGEKVIRRELEDPTVTMQMNRGFRPVHVIENYLDEEVAGNAAVLIVWDNPDYKDYNKR